MSNDDARIFRFDELDADTVEELLDGREIERYSQLTVLFDEIRPTQSDVDGSAFELVASQLASNRRRRVVPIAVASFAAAAALSFGGVAAASNALPSPVQSVTASVVAHIGLDIPKPGKSEDNAEKPSADIETTTTTIVPSSTTSVPATDTAAVHPGADACAEAREVDGAKGCSSVAKEHAPGQVKKSTTTTSMVAEATAPLTEDKSNNGNSKSKGHSADAGKSAEHGKGQNQKN